MYNFCGRDMNFLKFCKEHTTARSPYSFAEGEQANFCDAVIDHFWCSWIVMYWKTVLWIGIEVHSVKPELSKSLIIYTYVEVNVPGFANFIDELSQCDFCLTNFGVILEYLESSIRLSSTWSWHVYTIVRDTRSSCGGPLTWKAQIHDGGHRVNFDRNLPSSCFVVQYNSLISMI